MFDRRGNDDSVMTDSVLLGFVPSGGWSCGWSLVRLLIPQLQLSRSPWLPACPSRHLPQCTLL